MISDKMVQQLNTQINKEIYSGYLYLQMAAHLDQENLTGFAHWMKIQAQEEFGHAMKLYDFINARGGRVTLEAIEKPEADFSSVEDIFARTLQHERKVTALINELMDLAIEEHDHATRQHLDWFVNEQVEEEATASDLLDKMKMIKDGPGLLMLDRALSQRQA